jgi:beta-glucosidase/6-phospho-beta-glucosidase/beta-galactosidase
MLLAHAHAVDVYRKEFQEVQGGQIGITLSADWRLPAPSDDPKVFQANVEAAERSIVFHLGWFADPIFFGDYPQLMKDRVGDRLPTFTDTQKELVKGSSDFLGINNYGSAYASPSKDYVSGVQASSDNTGSFFADEGAETVSDPSWGKTAVAWFDVTPWGMYYLLTHITKTYKPKNGIVITENGSSWVDKSREEALNDDRRIDFLEQYLASIHKAIEDGADVRGYCVWSLFDNLRWANGFATHFGLIRVDFDDGLKRTLKKSAHWYHDTIAKNGYAVNRVLPNTTAAIASTP